MITIIDYKSGNLKSISNGFKKIGAEYRITDDKQLIADSDYLVLPGVGAFGSAMENLEPFKDVIYEHVNDDKPFLGICLGQQVLMGSSEESPDVQGGEYFYFVHSYHVIPDDTSIVAGVCDYGGEIVASLSQNNLFSTQFHPEKSAKAGLKILKNFTNLEI